MAPDSSASELHHLYVAYRQLELPRAGETAAVLNEADVELYEEDGYLAGLVDTYLETHKAPLREVSLNLSVDARLHEALKSLPGNATVMAFCEYRKQMHSLAKALNALTNRGARV